MDVKSLLRMVNNFEDNEKKEEEKRKQKNRITLDVFALTKMIK